MAFVVHTQSEIVVSNPLQKVEEHEKRTFLPLRTYVAGGKEGGREGECFPARKAATGLEYVWLGGEGEKW